MYWPAPRPDADAVMLTSFSRVVRTWPRPIVYPAMRGVFIRGRRRALAKWWRDARWRRLGLS
jgi:hypothetical protein